MPANIATGANGVHRAAYAYKPAWHGLGKVIDHAMKWRHAYKLAQLDYPLDQVPVYVKVGRGFVEAPDFRAIRRRDTEAIFGITSDKYRLIQNIEIGEVLDELVQAKEASYVALGALGGGERVWAVMELSRIKGLQVKGDPSKMEGFLVATTRHDGTGALNVLPAIRRVECQNMLDMAISRATAGGKMVSIRHTGDTAAAIERARDVLGFVNRYVEEFKEVSTALAETPIQRGFVDEFLATLIPIPPEMERTAPRVEARNAIAHLYRDSKTLNGVSGSAYRLMQAVAEYADHERPIRAKSTEAAAESRFKSILEGPSHDLKQSALDLLKEYAELVPVRVAAKA